MITPPSYTLDYVPGSSFNLDYFIHGYSEPIFIPQEHCKDWVNFNSYDEGSRFRVIVNLKMPSRMPHPGTNRCNFLIEENKNSTEGMIGARVLITGTIFIDVPFPGRYAELSLDVKNTPLGQPVVISPKVRNRGKETINAPLNIHIKNYDNQTVKSFSIMTGDISPASEKTFFESFNSEELGSARYRVYAELDYDGEYDAIAIKEFMIGDLFVELIGVTHEAEKENYVPVKLNVESWWGEPLNNVYADVIVHSEQGYMVTRFKTISRNLNPWAENELIGYMDASNMHEGIYNLKVTLHYQGRTSEFEQEFKLLAPLKESSDNLNVSYFMLLFNPIFLLVLILVILLLDIVWIMNHKKTN